MSVVTNEATNPSAETSLAPTLSGFYGWNGGTVSRVAADANTTGDWCVECNDAVADVGLQYYQDHSTTGDYVYSVDIWYVSGADDWQARAFDSASNLLASVDVTPTLTVQRIELPMPAVGAHTNLRIALTRKSSAAGVVRVDAVALNAGLVAVDYFDGDTADGGGYVYDWTGTPHDSTSTRTSVPASNLVIPTLNVRTNALLRR